MKIKLLVLIMLISGALQAQTIKGVLLDKVTQQPVPYATVALYNANGKLIVGKTSADNGGFTVEYGKQRGDAKIVISFIGYKSYNHELKLSGENINIGQLLLDADVERLSEAKVTAVTQRAVIKGDTTELNAAAFKVNPDASAQDLVTKMPGVSLQNGKVQAQGEEVKKVLVDGKEYFGSDVSAALGNMPADMIDRVQIIDEQSEMSRFTGFNDGNTSKALNIITKNQMSQSTVGKISGGYGTDDRYKINGSLNVINGNRRFSVLAQSNNVNEQNFSISDLVGATGMGGGRGMRGGNSDFMVNSQNGITKTNAIGLNFSDQWGKKIKFTGSYFFNRGDNDNEENTDREYTGGPNVGQFYKEQTVSNSMNTNHRFNVRFEYQIDSMNSLLLTPRLTLQKSDGNSSLFSTMTNNDNNVLNRTTNTFASELSGLSLSNSLLFRHKFNHPGRSFTFGFDNSYNKNSGNNKQNTLYEYFTDPDSSLVQKADLDQNGWSVAPSISLTEPLSKYSMLMADYRFNYQLNSSDKKTYELDTLTNVYDFNIPLSNIFDSKYQTHTTGLSYMFNYKKLQLNTKVSYQGSSLNNDQTFPIDNVVNKSFSAVLPSMRLMYRFSKSKNLMLAYRTSASSPSISQLQNVLDNSNPTQLKTGNPDLDQNYQHGMFSRYTSTSETGNSFFVMLAMQQSDNYIGNNTFVAETDTDVNIGGNEFLIPQGSQITSPENMSGFYNLMSFSTFGFPVTFIRSNLNVNARFSYNQTPSVINSVKSYVRQPSFGAGFTLSSNISSNLDFTLSTDNGYNIVRNSVNKNANSNYFSMRNTARINWIFLKHFVMQSDVNHNIYNGSNSANNQNYYLWNAAVGYKFLKQNAAEIKLSVFDILNQNRSYSRNSTSLYNEDINNNTLTQYFMVSFTYNFKKFKGRDPQANQPSFDGPPAGMPLPPHGSGGGGGRPF